MNKWFSKRGSIFLLVLVAMTVLFIFGFAITFFSSSEDYAAAMSYENEVAFSLAESAADEFAARVKYYLNDSSSNNYLYKKLRDKDTDITKDIPIREEDIINLTSFTRDQAANLFGMAFQNKTSPDFNVTATLKLDHIPAVKPTLDSNIVYHIKQDDCEKKGDLKVCSSIRYKGHTAKVSLNFEIKVVKTFIPPFNYFTLFVRDASTWGGSNFNVTTRTGTQITENNPQFGSGTLRLDNGWNFTHANFDAVKDYATWEKELARLSNDAVFPPGRVYLGAEVGEDRLTKEPARVVALGAAASGVNIRASNGYKTYSDSQILSKVNALDNLYLKPDIPWMNFVQYTKKVMKVQGQTKIGASGGVIDWFKDHVFSDRAAKSEIRVFNLGADDLLTVANDIGDGKPGFSKFFLSYAQDLDNTITAMKNGVEGSEPLTESELKIIKNVYPLPNKSGFYPLGTAKPNSNRYNFSSISTDMLSPTLVYGPANKMYFRATEFKTGTGVSLPLPYVPARALEVIGKKDTDDLSAEDAKKLFEASVPDPELVNNIVTNWDELMGGLTQYNTYSALMSNEGMEPINTSLGNFILRMKNDVTSKYTGDLEKIISFYLENEDNPYPYRDELTSEQKTIVQKSPMREYYEGALAFAFPNDMSQFLLDFYFVPRSTEDFFRGRKTVAIGGQSYDRFIVKYISDPTLYMNGTPNQLLTLNGILALNDEDPLILQNLNFKGHGVIYSSPMMGGGVIVVNGNLICDGTNVEKINTEANLDNMLTLIARKVAIDTSKASGDTCYVEANILSVAEPLQIVGDKPCVIRGFVATPKIDLTRDFTNVKSHEENVIIYNPLNTIWRDTQKYNNLWTTMYVAKITTGGVGKLDWKYERE